MISKIYRRSQAGLTGVRAGGGAREVGPASRAAMKRFHTNRTQFPVPPGRGDLGFSLIELMVVLAVLAALATVAAVGFRRTEFAGLSRRFGADVEGALVQARNVAIDRQTQVRVGVDGGQVAVTAYDAPSNSWQPVVRAAIAIDGSAVPNNALLTNNSAVCIRGFTAGVMAPSSAVAVDPPAACLPASGPVPNAQVLQFEPDGRFSDLSAVGSTFTDVANAGATLWISDSTVTGDTKFIMIQVFVGGLVRKFEDIRE